MLTQARKRGLSTLSKVASTDIGFFKSLLGNNCISREDGEDRFKEFDVDWTGKFSSGRASAVLMPTSTDQVASILKYCNERLLPVVPQGGNTGLVGGGVPMDSEIVLSTKKLDKIISFDQTSGILVCGSGCILESLDNYVKDKGYLMPIDLGAKGSCQIGGNISTNAGGLRLLRYGSLHGTVLGLEAVLPDGTVFDGLSTLRKDNTGYDLKQLFIGAEGTLGVVTAVSILTAPRPKYLNSALLAVKSFKDVCGIFELRHQLSEILSAFEFWDSCSNEIVHSHMSHLKPPLSQKAPFYVLLETSGSRQEHDLEKLEDFLELLMARELIVDGALATDYSKYRELWMIREGIPEACSKAGRVFKYDVSAPVPVLYDLVESVRERLERLNVPVNAVAGFGHIGDGNLHLNVIADDYRKDVSDALEPFIYEWIQKQGGSISAEHGIGQMKSKYLKYSKSDNSIDLMRTIKQTFDPNGIMNPQKYLPQPPQ